MTPLRQVQLGEQEEGASASLINCAALICSRSIEPVSDFTCGFTGEVRSLIVALNCGGIFGLVQIAVDSGLV